MKRAVRCLEASAESSLSISQSQFLLHWMFHKSPLCLSSPAPGETRQRFYHQRTDRKLKQSQIWRADRDPPAASPQSPASPSSSCRNPLRQGSQHRPGRSFTRGGPTRSKRFKEPYGTADATPHAPGHVPSAHQRSGEALTAHCKPVTAFVSQG